MSDQSEIAEAFRSSNSLDLDIPAYKTENYNIFVNDINNQSYSNGQVIFTTESVKDKQIVLSESFAAFPLSLTSSTGTAYDINTRLAIKTSLLSLIQGVRISTTNGTNIVDETSGSLPIINNLRLLTEEDLEFIEGQGQDLMFFGPDKFNQSNVEPGVEVLNAQINPVSGLTDLGSAPADNNVVFNKALSKRVSAFYTTASTASGTVWTIMAYIPLKYIHPYFKAMSFPLCNNPLQINFNISGIYNQTFLPWTTPRSSALPSLGTVANPTPIGVGHPVLATSGSSVILTPTTANPLTWYVGMPCVFNGTVPTGATLGQVYYWTTLSGANTLTTGCVCTTLALAISVSALGTGAGAVQFSTTGTNASLVPVAPVNAAVAAPAAPTMTIVGNISDRGFTQGACRLYFKTVTFREKHARELEKQIAAGYTKSITFEVCDLPPLANGLAQDAATLNTLLTSSVSRPVAVWCLFPPANSLTSTANSFPGTIGPNILTNANLMVNGVNFYPNQLQSQYDFYKILKKKMPEKGQLITYNDFLQGCNPYFFNISSSPSSEAGIACQLQLTGTLASGGNGGKGVAGKVAYNTTPVTYDFIVLIVRLQTCVMNISASAIQTDMKTGIAK